MRSFGRKRLTMEQVPAHGASQAVVEGEITLPGGLREETHVLHAGGMAVVDSAESGADRATLSGKVIFHVLYTQGAPNQVHVVEATADFIHQCDLPGAQPKGRVAGQIAGVHRQNGHRAFHADFPFATPIMTAQDSTGSRLNTEGMLEITLLYMTDENTAPVTVHQETPFRTSFAVSAAPDSIITLTADEVEATPITSDRVELRYVLRLTCDGGESLRR